MHLAIAMAEGSGQYFDVGAFHISVANTILVAIGIAIFVAALLLPFPGGHGGAKGGGKK
jgi:hypothetical protein